MGALLQSTRNFKYFSSKDDPHRFWISDITDSKNVIRYMSKKSPFRRPFDKQHGELAQALFKSASQYLYHIHWSLPSLLSWKKSLFLRCQILGLLGNTLATDEKYPVLTRDNLMVPIQKQLSQKQKKFSDFFAPFSKSRINFQYFEKNLTLRHFVFPKLRTPKRWSDKCLNSLASEDLSRSNIVNVPKHCWNLHNSIFIKFIDHWQANWLGKSFCLLHAESWDYLLIHWLLMKSILFLIETT